MHILKYFLLITTCTAYFFPQTFAVEVTKVNITKLEHRANQDSAEDQYNLGQLYEKTNNQGITQDYFKAIEWYTKAANQKIILNKNNIASYAIPRNFYYRIDNLISSADFKKSQNIPIIKEFFKQDCLKQHQNSCDFYKKLNN